jgi:hypothetical protein
MPNFDAVGEILRQAVEKLPERGKIARAERGRQLQPVLADARCQRRQAGEKLVA